MQSVEGLSMAILTREVGMSREEVLAMAAKVKEDLKNKHSHAYCPM